MLCAAIARNEADQAFDLTQDGVVDYNDVDHLVVRILGTTAGDANADGRFDSADLVRVFQAGEYDDPAIGNSTWSTGDWNCDGEFTSSDLVVAFQRGKYLG